MQPEPEFRFNFLLKNNNQKANSMITGDDGDSVDRRFTITIVSTKALKYSGQPWTESDLWLRQA